ncbi:U3 small nucleolar RNA-associated protein 14 homolog A [Diabrotica virgifera virgifera]|uniref:U3 small nucleolar RNA-associated protein 14 homolog A n=1 Tax=Diabrotica virgifera virgifera TaxID=50390 RepID=A0A6P7FL94_DIAVI|nr:U3 small nucleolar RNA-associated protein 14 homolog A [Diabrotica virgifera virgifera]
MSDDSDNFEYVDDEIDDKTHNKLVDNVLKLNKVQHVKSAHRTEAATKVSEFNLVKSLSNKNLVHVNELTSVLKGRKSLQLSNKIKSTSNISKTLPKPLEKPQAERIKRALNYEKAKLKLDRWEALVQANRSAAQLSFPLNSDEKVKVIEKRAISYPLSFRVKSDLQKNLENIDSQIEEYHIDTVEKKEDEDYPLTLEELKEKRKELAKLRAHQSFKEAKARRQNKIKSKKYHRILRKERIKQQLKEFEQLQKVNPEEALKKLEDIEKARAEERFSLRHKGTGQWARNKQVRAKYDKESRQELATQLALSRELTQKLKSVNSDSEDEGAVEDETSPTNQKVDESNPWVNGIKPTKEVADFVSGYRKYWNEVNKNNNKNEEEAKQAQTPNSSDTDESDIKNNNMIDQEDNKRVKKVKNKGENKIKRNEVSSSTSFLKNEKAKSKKKEKIKKENKTKEKTNMKEKPDKKESKKRKSLDMSEWEVSYNKSGNDDIEDMFDSLEDKMNKKISQKVTKIKKQTITKPRKEKKTKLSTKKKKIDLSLPLQKKKQILDERMMEETSDLDENGTISENTNIDALKKIIDAIPSAEEEEPVNINPDKFMKVKTTHLNTAIPDISMTDENEEPVNQRDLVMEAFEDDDIAVDFEKEKAAEIEKDTPKDIDLNLPGWGSWAGGNIDPSKRKRKRFIIKMPKKIPRRDDNKGSLIINEDAQSKITPLLVSEVPFPFKSVKEYENSIRAPIGNTFVPERAFRKYIEPSVVTKMGSIIKPIDNGILMGVKQV